MKIINLTPHPITIPVTLRPDAGEWTLVPSGTIARAAEIATPDAPIGDIPTCHVTYGAVEGLPEPRRVTLPSPCDIPGAVPEGSITCLVCGATDGHHPAPTAIDTYYVVSSLTAEAARRSGRTLDDLLVPGQSIRDADGRIVGCQSLARVVR
jgi:hypothetical protein